jgi:hypothetical protein
MRLCTCVHQVSHRYCEISSVSHWLLLHCELPQTQKLKEISTEISQVDKLDRSLWSFSGWWDGPAQIGETHLYVGQCCGMAYNALYENPLSYSPRASPTHMSLVSPWQESPCLVSGSLGGPLCCSGFVFNRNGRESLRENLPVSISSPSLLSKQVSRPSSTT